MGYFVLSQPLATREWVNPGMANLLFVYTRNFDGWLDNINTQHVALPYPNMDNAADYNTSNSPCSSKSNSLFLRFIY